MNPDVIKAILLCAGVGGGLIWFSFKRIKVRRLVEDTPTSKARSAAQGFTELQGYAWTMGPTVKCSLGQDCVYYFVQLQKYVKRGKNSNWETVFSRGLINDFLVVDSTGAVQIHLPNADFQIEKRTTNWNKLSSESREQLIRETFPGIAVAGFPPADGFFGIFAGSFRIIETTILLGSPLLILGEFETIMTTSQTVHEVPGLVSFYDKVQNDPRLKIGRAHSFFDLDKNGRVEADELRRGLHYLARSLIKNPGKPSSMASSSVPLHGIIRKPDNHEFIIIDSHQNTLMEAKGYQFYALFLLGSAMILFAIYVLMNPTVFRF